MVRVLRTVRLIAKGRVQRVGYRRYIQDIAQELGIVGYVKITRTARSRY